MQSALYAGRVWHRRFAPQPHRFEVPLFMAYVDLDELATVFRGSLLWSARRPAVAWLRRADYFGEDRGRSWADTVRDAVVARTGRRPDGAVRLLTHPRTLGLRMNPVSFYYCHDREGALEAVVGEVTNTPWNERHLYVMHRDAARRGRAWSLWMDKTFHVSPFLPMDMMYRWVVQPPGRRLFVHFENHRAGKRCFDASLSLRRVELTPASLRGMLLRHPAMTWRVLLWIYVHALVLAWKRAPFYSHPKALPGGPS